MHGDVDVVAIILAVAVVFINWGVIRSSVEGLKRGQEEIREDIRTIYAALIKPKE